MLKYKRTDIVVYFSYNELDYRRVDSCWEVCLDGIWMLSKDCEWIESQYKKRINLRNLIKRKECLSQNSLSDDENSTTGELSVIVRKLIDTLGIGMYMDNTAKQLLDKLDTGEIQVK